MHRDTAFTQQTCTCTGAIGNSGALAKHREFTSATFYGLQVPAKVQAMWYLRVPLWAWRPVVAAFWLAAQGFFSPPGWGRETETREGPSS